MKKKASRNELSNAVSDLSNAVDSALSNKTTFDDVSSIVSDAVSSFITQDDLSSCAKLSDVNAVSR